ncbi:hypothetical protein ACN4EG_06885 [Alkalinema pantanalense CENA528]|uniref:hypothetical protein n=1 Tax=Alkalinema pantanalense TaxID=1620705 RepID=UPI003D6E5035
MKIGMLLKNLTVFRNAWIAGRKQRDEQQIQEFDRLIRSQIADLDRWVDNRFPLSIHPPLDRS